MRGSVFLRVFFISLLHKSSFYWLRCVESEIKVETVFVLPGLTYGS
jgi:hypothetical protein